MRYDDEYDDYRDMPERELDPPLSELEQLPSGRDERSGICWSRATQRRLLRQQIECHQSECGYVASAAIAIFLSALADGEVCR